MKALLIALLITATLNGKIEIPEVKKSLLKRSETNFSEEIKSLSNFVQEGNWFSAISKGISFMSKMKDIIPSGSENMSSILETLIGKKEKKCPYKKCVERRLKKAHKVAHIFLHLVFHKKTKKARKVLKCLTRILYWATECKKKKE